MIGKEGVNLQDLWEVIPEAYLSMAPSHMPNYYCFLGPNGGPGLGSALPFLENEGKYMIKVIQKIQREWIKSMVVKCVLPDAHIYLPFKHCRNSLSATQGRSHSIVWRVRRPILQANYLRSTGKPTHHNLPPKHLTSNLPY